MAMDLHSGPLHNGWDGLNLVSADSLLAGKFLHMRNSRLYPGFWESPSQDFANYWPKTQSGNKNQPLAAGAKARGGGRLNLELETMVSQLKSICNRLGGVE